MRNITVILTLALLLVASTMTQAMDINLYIDTAPNGNGSPYFSAWKTAAYADAANGTFVNMRSGTYSGTTVFEPTEAIVYSTGDLGRMLYWSFWIPNVTTSSLVGNIQCRACYDWDGVDYTSSWTSFSNLQDYTNSSGVSGVVGTFGYSWWANDNCALPYDTDGAKYNETDAADVAELAAEMCAYQTYFGAQLQVRENSDSEWQTTELRGNVAVPEPMSIILGIMGLGSIAGFKKLRK